MAAAAGYSVTFGAVDNVTATIDKINKRLEAFNAPIAKMQKSFDRLREVSGFNKIEASFANVHRSALAALGTVERLVPALGAITGAASVAGMARMVQNWAAFNSQLGYAAQRMGLPVQQLYQLQNAARLGGTSADAMARGIENLGQTIYDVVGGRNGGAAAMLLALKVPFGDINKPAGTIETFNKLRHVISGMHNPLAQLQAAQTLFGRSAAEMLPILRETDQQWEQNQQSARRYGGVLGNSTPVAIAFQRSQTALTEATESLQNAIAERLAPVIKPVMDLMAGWISKNKEWLAYEIGDKVGAFATWIEGVNWKQIGGDIGVLATDANDVAQAVGGWRAVLEGLFLFMGARFAASMILPFVKLAAQIRAVTGEFGTMKSAMAGRPRNGSFGAGFMGATLLGAYLNAPEDGAAIGAAINRGLAGGPVGSLMAWLDAQSGGRLGYDPATGSWRGLLGGGGAAGAGGGGAGAAQLAPEQQSAFARYAFDYFKAQGYTPAQAAGLVANFKAESGFNPGAIGDHGTAYGLGQWHADRQAAFARWAGHSIQGSTLQEQLAFANYELTQGGEQQAGAALRNARTPAEAGAAVSMLYERPGDQIGEAARRGQSATWMLPQLQAPEATGAPGVLTGGGSVTAAGANAGAGKDGTLRVHLTKDPGTPKIQLSSPDRWVDTGRIEAPMLGHI